MNQNKLFLVQATTWWTWNRILYMASLFSLTLFVPLPETPYIIVNNFEVLAVLLCHFLLKLSLGALPTHFHFASFKLNIKRM